MKGGKKQFLKKLLIYILSVFILSLSIGDVFIRINDIDTSYAAAPVALGLDAMYSICEYYGSVFLSYTCGRSMPELSSDDVAELGHDLMLALTGFDGIFEPDIVYESPFMTVVVDNGQPYVFGSEALQEVAETDFTVIQGGKNDGDGDDNDDDDDDKNDNIIHFPKAADAARKFFAMTTVGAAAVSAVIKAEYAKWVNGDADNILDPFFVKYPAVTQADVAEQSTGVFYTYNWNSFFTCNNVGYNGVVDYRVESCVYSGASSYRTAGYYLKDSVNPSTINGETVLVYEKDVRISTGTDGYIGSLPGGSVLTSSIDGKKTITNSSSWVTSYSWYSRKIIPGYFNGSFSFSANFPIFATQAAAEAYLKNGTGYENALNYANPYRNADWLQDDWAGELLDPLTGLTALSNWYNLARHQGLNALGNDPSIQDLLNYLRDYFANLGTDVLPEVDPSFAPVKYPSTLPDVSIDPGRNPAVIPSPGSGTKPDSGTTPNPGTDPDPGADPLPGVDIDPMDYQTELRGLFPFCIPFDFVALLNTLDADPVAPCFTYPVSIPALDYREDITLDMSVFDDVAKVIRICEKVSFLIFLMFATSKVIRW